MKKKPTLPPWLTKLPVHLTYIVRLLSTLPVLLLGGCSQMVLLDPKGPVGSIEKFVILTAFGLMLLVVIPVLIMVFWFPWKYRAANKKADYAPKWNFSAKIEIIVWTVPALIVICLGILAWKTTYLLDPYRPIASTAKPITIEAVALDWKWLFIYPDENIAVVNHLVFPANVPLNFKITSDTVMTSFFIPQLGSQIYAMAGMETRLHLLADTPGTYTGQNQQLSGEGYAYMNFKAIAVSSDKFKEWLQDARRSSEKLDPVRYRELTKPTSGYPVTYFSSVKPDLFQNILQSYRKSTTKVPGTMSDKPKSMPKNTAGLEDH